MGSSAVPLPPTVLALLLSYSPRIRTDTGDSVVAIVGLNGSRRHLTTGQHAMLVAIGLWGAGKRITGKDGKRRWTRDSIPDAMAGSGHSDWRRRLREAGVVLDYDVDLAHMVLSGAIGAKGDHHGWRPGLQRGRGQGASTYRYRRW